MSRYNNLNLKIFLLLFVFGFGAFSQTLLAPKLERKNIPYDFMCSRSSADIFPIKFSFKGDEFDGSNVFFIELSDANGSFANPRNIKTVTGENSSFNVETSITLPEDVYGKGYKIRVRSTSPPRESIPSSSFEAFFIGNVKVPVLNDRKDLVLCEGESKTITLDETTGSFVWFKNGNEIPNEHSSSLVVNSSGEYYAKPDYGRCVSFFSNSIKVSVFSSQSVAIEGGNNVVLCGNESYTLKSTVTNTRDFEYAWYKDDNLIEGANTPTYTTPTNNQFGVYQVVLKPKTNTCESKSQKVTLSQKEKGDFEVDVKSSLEMIILPSDIQILEISHTASQATIQWYIDGTPIPGAQDKRISVSKAGVYTASVTDTKGDCPFVITSKEIQVLDIKTLKPVLATTGYESCVSTSLDISMIGVEAIATNEKVFKLSVAQIEQLKLDWYKENTLKSEFTGKKKIGIASYKENGEYFMEASIQGVKGNSDKVEINLLAAKFKIESSSTSNVICSSESVTLKVVPLIKGVTYEWSKDGEKLDNTSLELNVTEIGMYKVKVSSFGCEKELELEIKQFDDSVVKTTPSQVAVLSSDGNVKVTAEGADSYEWYNEAGDAISLTAILNAAEIGEYTVVAKVNECSVRKKVKVVLDDGSFVIPNILTPFNADGVNDTWQLPNKFAFQSEVKVIIYNSRGKEVLNTSDYQNNWPEDNNLKDGMLFYFKVLKKDTLIKAGTISVLK